MELTVTDLLQLPILREAKVLTEGSYDPYRPVAARCMDPQVGPGIFCEAELDAILASLVDDDAWPALCVVSPDTDAPPADERFGAVVDRASSRGAALLWLHSKEPTEDLHLRFYQELLAYHEDEVEESRRIQRRLNEIVVAGGTLHEICRELAVLTQNPVSIKTAYHEVVAFYDIGNPDSARRRTNAAGSVPDDILQALHTAGLPGRLQTEVGAFRFGPLPEIDYHSRVMASIRTESAVWGYISIAECTHELGLLDLSAVESAANCAALIVWKTRALEQRTREQQTRFIGDLLFAEQEPETFTARAHLLGYDPAERYQAVVLQWTNSADEVRAPHLGGRRHEVARTVDSFLAASGARALVYSIPVGDRVVCLWPATAGDPTRLGPRLLERLGEGMPLDGLRAGVGAPGRPARPAGHLVPAGPGRPAAVTAGRDRLHLPGPGRGPPGGRPPRGGGGPGLRRGVPRRPRGVRPGPPAGAAPHPRRLLPVGSEPGPGGRDALRAPEHGQVPAEADPGADRPRPGRPGHRARLPDGAAHPPARPAPLTSRSAGGGYSPASSFSRSSSL